MSEARWIPSMKSLLFLRLAVAATWFYQGLYLKLLLRDPHSLKMITASFGSSHSATVLTLVGVGETLLGLATLIGLWTRPLAWFQVALVLAVSLLAISNGAVSNPAALIVADLPFFACLGMLAIHGPGCWNV